MALAFFGLLERIEIVLVKIKYYIIAMSSEVRIGSLHVAESPSEVSSSQSNSSPMVEEIVVGLEDTTTQIVSKLVGGPNYCQIISIVGMGGLGKTTLAKKVYNDSRVRYHFLKLSWCVVSQTYKRKKLLIDILSSVSRDDISKIKDEEESAELLYKSLKGRRYLIIVDDLWEKEAWDDLKRLFPNDSNGSRVMFTSRLKNVASKISHVIIEPPPLSPDESWNLLEQKVFKKECCPQELQDIGKQIAANCKGLPLSVVLIAGILSNMEKKESSWRQVAKSLSYYIFQKADEYIPTLKLSYVHLPDHLKPCFLYLSAFQEDEEIPVRKLLLLWIVEGFIEKREQKTLEDVAEEYLMELIDRSLLQVNAIAKSSSGFRSGARKDGSSVHFFYRTVNAYANGQRKRRKIYDQENSVKAYVRWHKTGKTKPVMENGVQIGCKKILVLYASKKGSRPDKCNWVMHQYHLGNDEDEREGQYVVSKIFYQPGKDIDKNENSLVKEESDWETVEVIPSTPKTTTPDPPRPENTTPSDVAIDDYAAQSLVHVGNNLNVMDHHTCLDGESRAVEFGREDSLSCNEMIDSYAMFGNLNPNNAPSTQVSPNIINTNQRDDTTTCGISDLENLELDTPLDFLITDLKFESQDSAFDWLNQL
ncbi:late blight resistance homolog R1A-10 [Olea europaea subsp. europaea]|uniref:Late blight resistance homolog R1A-10 n=1 Tax=Olea europaea subsp. europaea TaxID=158383 RepID=A0A8S0SLS4_OLEEU|nr:late blight resistance homolog R1A-10 [Olea europaea subsp. europaea]